MKEAVLEAASYGFECGDAWAETGGQEFCIALGTALGGAERVIPRAASVSVNADGRLATLIASLLSTRDVSRRIVAEIASVGATTNTGKLIDVDAASPGL